MSYVLTNELERAEDVLQAAAADPRATLKTRENLALVQRLRAEGGSGPQEPVIGTAPPAAEGAAGGVLQEDIWAELAQNG